MKRAVATIGLAGLYGACWLAGLLAGMTRRSARSRPKRLALVGAFDNPGWVRSHLRPLAASGLAEVIVVADTPGVPIPGVRCVRPPAWAQRWLSRVGARAVWLVWVAWRERVDCVMGYHIVPNGCLARCVSLLVGATAGFQLTGGPVEFLGGGVADENPLARRLGRPSRWLERLAVAGMRSFDLVIVRGRRARQELWRAGLNGQVRIIPGSVSVACSRPEIRDIDMIFVGRLAEIKQPEQWLEVVACVHRQRPGLRAVIVGAGPMHDRLQQDIASRGLGDVVHLAGQQQDVMPWLARSKVLLLTSRSEGLPIAVLEAMSVGAVPVVADVGELRDVVIEGVTGHVVRPGDSAAYARAVERLLAEPKMREALSRRARRVAGSACSVRAVGRRWADAWTALAR